MKLRFVKPNGRDVYVETDHVECIEDTADGVIVTLASGKSLNLVGTAETIWAAMEGTGNQSVVPTDDDAPPATGIVAPAVDTPQPEVVKPTSQTRVVEVRQAR